ncbi:pyridoxal phosphate-dependent aminotransferase [Magnetovibrio blakemorei]|uniref:Aminotransferase n=1 Tax=Magnetovibrio blakemorei TaxID=28181 RepID=A0A1E5QBR1_9PROT|nr:aminotransferase class I/II-fold pyridoxal phosphate-dependent enzyme [Magnetovibrio blakemorei]OEJ69516.1 1-aminocyclopropane-1-carboxylate deaminase [Magnetovibrio blakemorei]
MTLKVSKRGAISPFIVMDVMRAANARQVAGHDVLHMEVGQPSTSAPAQVLARAREALDQELLGYTDAFGVPALKTRIVAHYQKAYGVSLDPARIAVTTGSSGGFLLAFLSAFDAGDRVALVSPGYPAYRNILTALDIEVVDILTGPETDYQPTPALLDQIEGRLDGLIIASPSNPTGTMIDRDGLAALAVYCRARGVRVVSDEIYHGITFEEPAHTFGEFETECFIVNSFSKYYSMTGWRLGWLVFPESLSRSVECLAQNLFISAPTLSQIAAVAAFDCQDELDANVVRYKANRDVLLAELPKAGFDRLSHAQGAFYVYADVAHLTDDSQVFCQKILAETGVAVTPGVDFDPQRGHSAIRFSFAGSTADMIEAARRLKVFHQSV